MVAPAVKAKAGSIKLFTPRRLRKKTMEENDEDCQRRRALLTVSDGVLGAAVLLACGVYGGNWLDARMHTAPWLSVALSILGGGLGLARMVMKASALDTKLPAKGSGSGMAKQSSSRSKQTQEQKTSAESKPQRLPFEGFDE